MSNDLIVQPAAALRSVSDALGGVKTIAVEASPSAEHTSPPSPIPNPSLRIDPALGLVVIEFRNNSGAITTSIPSQRQLAAYQKWGMTRSGPPPPVVLKPSKPTSAEPAPEPHVHAAITKMASNK
jgi:hypothetical protein